MEKRKPTSESESSYAEKIKQASDPSKNAVVRENEDPAVAQNVILIWLDNKIDENNEECQDIITQLRYVVNFVKIFNDVDQCIDFLINIYNEKIFIIISDAYVKILCHLFMILFNFIASSFFVATKQHTSNGPRNGLKLKIFLQGSYGFAKHLNKR